MAKLVTDNNSYNGYQASSCRQKKLISEMSKSKERRMYVASSGEANGM